jgi:hypothetical protein
MKPIDLIAVAMGFGIVVIGVFVQELAIFAIPTGVGLIVSGIPQLSSLVNAIKNRALNERPGELPRQQP